MFLLETAQSALKKSFLDAAIAKCGGNEEKGRTLYSAYGSNGQVFDVPHCSLCYSYMILHISVYPLYELLLFLCVNLYFFLILFCDYSPTQWGLFDRTFGRTDTQEADPEGRVPDWSKASVQEMKDRFVAVGLGPRQVATTSFAEITSFPFKVAKTAI